MFKKIALSTAFMLSSFAIAQINLDLDLVISFEDAQTKGSGSVIIDENEITSVVFNNIESLIIDFLVEQKDNNAIIRADFFQKTESDELLPIAETLGLDVPLNETATFTINEENGTGSLVLTVIPSLINQ